MKNNRRSLKNIIVISLIILLIGGLGCTIYFANKNNSSFTPSNENNMPTPPEMNNNDNTPPAKPGEENDDTNNENKSEENNEQVKSETENNENETTTKQETTNTTNNMPQMDNNRPETPSQNLTIYYILIGIESLILSLLVMYLIMSCFNKKTLKEVFVSNDKKLIYILSAIIITFSITFGSSFIINNNQKNNSPGINSTNSNIKYSAKEVINSKKKESSKTIETTTEDESAIIVEDGGNLTLTNSTINKTSGDSTNTENSEFYGVNAGVLVTEGTATIKNTNITTNAKGSNALFATGENSKIYISDSTIKTTGSSSSRGLDATYGGYIEAENISITTKGGSSASLATDRGEGTIKVSNSTLETNGSGSPVIYSTGNISITKTKGVANGSQMVVIEGKNSATVTDSTLEASAKGNRGDVDHAGIMIYQSMSGDAGEGTGTFTAKNSTLTIKEKSDYYKTAPMFFITNTDAVINLENTTLNYGSNILLSIKSTNEWGNSGSNGGKLVFNANNEQLVGDIYVDKISNLSLNLVNSTYKGTINKDNTSNNITLKLDKNSKIILTGDSYITSLYDEDSSYSNIDFNNYKLYINGKSIN